MSSSHDAACLGNTNEANDLSARAVRKRLAGLEYGELRLVHRGAEHRFGGGNSGEPSATIQVRDAGFYRQLALGGALGAAESYMAGDWDCDDLTTLVRIMLRNREVLEGLDRWYRRLGQPFAKLAHRLRANTRRGSRRNIAAHYDLGNEFFALFLDPTMAYSSAVFPTASSTLAEAATHKLDLVCRKLALGPEDHLLEIGTGWGGLAVHAALEYGCRVTTTTISREQYQYTRDAVDAAGLGEQVTVLADDYRDLNGQYDKLVSIEMIEAVGLDHLPEYFRTCAGLLKKDGVMLLQSITIADQRFEDARHSVDFIQKYIFPGGALPSLGAIAANVARHSDFVIIDLHDIGSHYARTLAAWRAAYHANLRRVIAQGYPSEFRRMWDYYLCYCEGAFRERAISTVQTLLARPDHRPASSHAPPGKDL